MDVKLNERFRELYFNPNLHIHDIARELNVSEATVCRWRNKLNLPSIYRYSRRVGNSSPGYPNTQEKVKIFKEDWKTLSTKELIAKYHISWDRLKHWGMLFGSGRSKEANKKREAELTSMNMKQLPSYEDLIDLMTRYSEIYNARHSQKEIYYTIETDKPVGLVFTSDWHLGHPGVDYTLFNADINLILETEGLFVYIGGDATENMLLPQTLTSGLQMDINLQFALLIKILEKLREKIIAIGTGNHTLWTEKLSKIDILSFVLAEKKLLYTKYGGMLNLTVGEVEYKIYRRHSYRMRSSFNLTHDIKQMLRLENVDFDIGVLEHGHIPVLEEFYWKDKKRVALHPGSYKVLWDDYAEQKGFTGTRALNPTILLNPNKFEVLSFLDMRSAIEVLNSIRGK